MEKLVVVPDPEHHDLCLPEDALLESETSSSSVSHKTVDPHLATIAYEFGKYLSSFPSKSALSSQACKHVYANYPSAREILARHGRLRGLVKSCPYLQLDGASLGGTYTNSVNMELFAKLL